MAVSVALAAYNGQAYIDQQIQSILEQLEAEDELIVSLDPSQDRSAEVLAACTDPRLKVLAGPGQGLIANFENALRHCRQDYIFMADQDDIWLPNKRKVVVDSLKKGSLLVVHDAQIVDQDGCILEPSYFAYRHSGPGYWKNILKNSYIGCCMAFRKELLPYILPFPAAIPMHDQWIGLIAERQGRIEFCPQVLLSYRRHLTNVSQSRHASLKQMLIWRYHLLQALKKRR